MSLLPLLYSNWWEDLEHPHSLVDQHFGHGVNPEYFSIPPQQRRMPASAYYYHTPALSNTLSKHPASTYMRPWDNFRQGHGGASIVKADKDQFQVSLDVQQFAPAEIDVKVVDRTVVVEGKHEEKQDEHGWISRSFSRRYMIPEQCDIEQVASKLSSDGVLSITVPRKEKPKIEGERSIKIDYTGKPAIHENGEAKLANQVQGQQQEEKK